MSGLYSLLSNLKDQLSEYEADLEKLNEILSKLDTNIESIENLKKMSLDILAVDDKPFKEELIDISKGNLESAAGFISGTAIPIVEKKIAELHDEISRVEAEIRRLEEEERRRRESEGN